MVIAVIEERIDRRLRRNDRADVTKLVRRAVARDTVARKVLLTNEDPPAIDFVPHRGTRS